MMTGKVLFLGCLLVCLLLSFYARVGMSYLSWGHICPDDTAYDSNTTSGKSYRANLDSLFSALVSNASGSPIGFYNLTVGSITSSNDPAVYGLFLCRGDVQASDCEKCVTTASSEVLSLCPERKVATIWFDYCLVELIVDTMYQIATMAKNSDKKFAVRQASSSSGTVYALAQCTPDLSSLDCGTCLRRYISIMLPAKPRGGRFLHPNCNARYELYPFFNALTPPPEPTPPPPPETTPPPPEPTPPPPPETTPPPPEPTPPPPPETTPPPPEPTPPPPPETTPGKSRRVAIPIALSIVSSVVLFIISFVFLKRRSIKKHPTKMPDAVRTSCVDTDDITIDPESLQYSFRVIELATNKFSVDNKIGQGGFGSVYKGKLPNGQDIAVKRLSKSSTQGVAEFKNEIGVVAKLQHNNLVRLLGFCLEGEEKILVYEFVPNRSLDYFLFDSDKKGLLNWSRRRNIIAGVARGLLYLHEDSRLKIVHRDLKAGNILLDEDMQPKIADFGMAKICRIDQSEANTTKIAGTLGYMAPEYTISGHYSIKSDVFSFGVVLLEIITGKQNSAFYQSEESEDLLSYVWRHWRDDTPLAVLDQTIGDSYFQNEVIQSLHVGLLCVEEDANKRPTMASVVYILNSTSISLPVPRRPATRRHHISENTEKDSESDHANNKLAPASANIVSITEPCPR